MLELKVLAEKQEEKELLQKDQIEALKKLDSVVEMIDMLKEINKNISDSLNDVMNHDIRKISFYSFIY